MSEERNWIMSPPAWGPIPTPRHSVITWTSEDRYLYVYGGVLEHPPIDEINTVYQFDTVSFTWAKISTTGVAPPLEFRLPSWAVWHAGKLYNIIFVWKEKPDPRFYIESPLICSCYVLNTATWIWEHFDTNMTNYCPSHLWKCTAAMVKNKLFFLGGCTNYELLPISILNTTNWEWLVNTFFNPPPPVLCGSCIGLGKDIFLSGGYSSKVKDLIPTYPPHRLYKLDTETLHWTSLVTNDMSEEISQGREGHVLIFPKSRIQALAEITAATNGTEYEDPDYNVGKPGYYKNRVYFAGGAGVPNNRSQQSYIHSIGYYDCLGYNFQSLENTNLYYNRLYPGGQIIGNKIYLFGGKSIQDKIFNDIHVYSLLPNDVAPPVTTPPETFLLLNPSLPPLSLQLPEAPKIQPLIPHPPPPPGQNTVPASVSSVPPKSSIPQNNTSKLELLEVAFNNKDYFPDIRFRLHRKKIYAHKLVLFWNSTYFQRRFQGSQYQSIRPSQKAEHNDKGKERETIEDEDEYSMWSEDQYFEDFNVPDFWDYDLFIVFLKSMYSGKLQINSKAEAKLIGEMAFEYLMDPLMKFCTSCNSFPAMYCVPESARFNELRKAVGRPIGSDISFVFRRSQRLLAHKFLLLTFCEPFKNIISSNRQQKYIEVNDQISSKDFIIYLRYIYCGQYITARDDPGAVAIVSLVYEDKKATNTVIEKEIFTLNTVYFLYEMALEKGETVLAFKAEQYMIKNFSKVTKTVNQWKPELVKRINEILVGPFTSWCHFCTWLDVLWFSHHTENTELQARAVEQLQNLLNIENVVPVLIAAHASEEKTLRTKCIDIVILHSAYVEEFQRMRIFAESDIKEVSKLSMSMKDEITKKIQQRVTSLQTDLLLPQPKTKVTLFNKKKRTCSVCQRIVEPEEIKNNVILPPLFGDQKPRQVCIVCEGLSTLVL